MARPTWLYDGNEPESLEEAVGMAVGAASACWENLSGAGEFNSQGAIEVVNQLVEWIRAHE